MQSPAVHGDEDMDAARQSMVTFDYATAVSDGEAAAAVLHDDLTTSWGATKEGDKPLNLRGTALGSKLRLKQRHSHRAEPR